MGYLTSEPADGCLRLRLANTDANLLTIDVVHELQEALRAAEISAGALMLCGGDRFFCNGLDLPWALTQSRAQMRGLFESLAALVLHMLRTPLPLVGVIRGHAIGAGKTLFTACDYRYAASGRVLLGVPEILLGVPNPFFADQLLRFVAGDALASDLIYSGRLVAAETCVTAGLVHHVAAKDEIEDAAWEKTVALAALPRAAFAASKSMRTTDLCTRIERDLARWIEVLLDAWTGAEAQSRLHAAANRLNK